MNTILRTEKENLVRQFHLIGYQPAGGAAQYAVWNAAADYVFPAAAAGLEIVSASANDAAAGTGLRTVRIDYLDGNFAERSETVTLNGTGVVATTATNIFRVNRMKALTAGSGGVAAGIISLRNLADTPMYGYIGAGDIESKQAIFTVPAGQILEIENILACSMGTTALKYQRIIVYSSYDPILKVQDRTMFTTVFQAGLIDTGLFTKLDTPLVFPPTTDIIVKCLGAATSLVTATLLGGLYKI